MKINKIVKIKDNKYKIYVDDECIITYDNVILDNNLLYKKEIDKTLYNKILLATNYYDVYNKTVKFTLKSRKSEKEILDYLDRFEISYLDKRQIISKLKEINLINDLDYCKAFINDKVYLGKMGINKIKDELLKKSISIEIIEQELNKVDTTVIEDKLEKIIVKKINSNHKYSNYQLKQKLLNEMMNLGYSKESIIRIVEDNLIYDNSIIEKEFNKNYNKLKIKYDGLELKNKLKQKLIQKGFELDRINELLDDLD